MPGLSADLRGLLSLGFSSPLLPWLLGSMLAYVLATDVVCVFRKRGRLRSPRAGWLLQAGRLFFLLIVPYLALGGWPRPPFSGLFTLPDLGMVGWEPRWPAARWIQAMGDALGMALVSLAILLLAWVNANRRPGPSAAGYDLHIPQVPWWCVLLDILALEVHWAFYRTAFVLVLDGPYAGVFAGLGLVYLEWILSALWWRNWQSVSRPASIAVLQWLRIALALLSALVFLVTRNLWACFMAHGLVDVTLRRVCRRAGVQRPQNATGVDVTH